MRTITKNDILDMNAYGLMRDQRRHFIIQHKKNRSVNVGPYMRVMFEDYETIWNQIHEMLFIEKGGEAQIQDELDAYLPLLPTGQDLVTTIMFEIPDAELRKNFLLTIGNIDQHFYLEIEGIKSCGLQTDHIERTNKEGKASSVHFIRFEIPIHFIQDFENHRVILGSNHPAYLHEVILTSDQKLALKQDFSNTQ